MWDLMLHMLLSLEELERDTIRDRIKFGNRGPLETMGRRPGAPPTGPCAPALRGDLPSLPDTTRSDGCNPCRLRSPVSRLKVSETRRPARHWIWNNSFLAPFSIRASIDSTSLDVR